MPREVKNENQAFYEDVVRDVTEDFSRRQMERAQIEKQWELNLNYLSGNQYCEIASNGEVEETEKYYFWQSRNAYNHIAPVVDIRISKLTRNCPVFSVRAQGEEESDVKSAKLASALLKSAYSRVNANDIIAKATMWSEVCGTSFYHVGWNGDGGKYLGAYEKVPVYEGDILLEAVSPFEIFPDSLCAENISQCASVIRARAVRIEEIEGRYGVSLEGGDVSVFSLKMINSAFGENAGVLHGGVVLIERFERPNVEYPNGRYIAVAGNKILSYGELPYINGVEGRRDIPFIQQNSIDKAGSFFGSSIIERLIPVQRAYNAVKNRKQEFLNRLTMGVVSVEDGSVDVDDLAEDGLSPGKILVYRQGTRPPSLIGLGNIPSELIYEEERLLNEFILISGVSEFSRTSNVDSNISSGVALQLLIEQEEARMNATGENLKRAVKEIGKHMIRVFKQFATETRLLRVAGESGKVELYYFSSSDLSSDDVELDTENGLAYTPAQKKNAVYELIGAGILNDDSGKMTKRTKAKLLEILGFGSIDNALDLEGLHVGKAETENVSGFEEDIEVDEYDDHEIHVQEHTRYLLSVESEGVRKDPVKKQRALTHVRAHKIALAEQEG
ncbi:MAG: hypothetical protein IKA61_04920 [Clostridia bacterium]|nr:hypothetical protein [Clostridia bacterium]